MVISNLRAFIGISGSLGGSRALAHPEGLCACDCGLGSAYENYALLEPRDTGDTERLVAMGFDFFVSAGSPHIWPLFPNTPPHARALLEGRGARRDDTFYGMTARLTLEHKAEPGGTADGVWVSDPQGAGEWADAAWYGFDSGEPAPEGFVRFAREIALRDEVSLFGLRDPESGLIAATGLLCAAGGTAGIYYVSSRPEFRRKGLGTVVMRALMGRGCELGHENACLLATPAGRPLYRRCGFEESGAVEIMIHDGAATDGKRPIR
ncbi:MAG: GNAT family N-acetyltransferase [Synergistaceae bacterium]|jgi:GNAT superfamily N-acetyltransferase|nr:GNAT family N-acetyltransferase [Synergistaceae bacterium]